MPEDVRTTCGRRIVWIIYDHFLLKAAVEVKCDTHHNQQIGSWIKAYDAIVALPSESKWHYMADRWVHEAIELLTE